MAKKKRKSNRLAGKMDRHILYEESVQSLDFDLSLTRKFYQRHRGKVPHFLREDFCGTAALSAEWVRSNKKNQAWGIDLDKPTLNWGKKHHVALLDKEQKERISLIRGDVLTAETPPADIVLCLNFSCFIFKTRDLLRNYFEIALNNLKDDGVLVMDIFGGQQSMIENTDEREIDGVVRPDGTEVPDFTYIWDQARFNAITHEIQCHIHFEFEDGSKIKKAFSYDWRLWNLPELQELMKEAGFKQTAVYLHGWDKDGEGDDNYRRRTFYENEEAWIGYIVGLK